MNPVVYLNTETLSNYREAIEYSVMAGCITFAAEGWYFWDETWSNLHGPFISRETANAEMKHYLNTL